MSRLSQQYVDLHRALSARSAVDQQAVVERLIAAALDANGLTAADVSAPGEVERLDEQAWLVQEQVERGSATQEQYEAAFRRARAASAVQSLAGPQVALEDAAYEAVHALPADVDALPIISGCRDLPAAPEKGRCSRQGTSPAFTRNRAVSPAQPFRP